MMSNERVLTVSNKILDVLQGQDKSMYWLEKNTVFSAPTVRKWCYNKSQPNLNQLAEIASVLGVTVEELIVEDYK